MPAKSFSYPIWQNAPYSDRLELDQRATDQQNVQLLATATLTCHWQQEWASSKQTVVCCPGPTCCSVAKLPSVRNLQ